MTRFLFFVFFSRAKMRKQLLLAVFKRPRRGPRTARDKWNHESCSPIFNHSNILSRSFYFLLLSLRGPVQFLFFLQYRGSRLFVMCNTSSVGSIRKVQRNTKLLQWVFQYFYECSDTTCAALFNVKSTIILVDKCCWEDLLWLKDKTAIFY